ncbi:hypothetical protein [Methanobrevibacter arboriphilus]|nr:hypothetical protein [Methanobrevibacter arboriphilus]
MDFLKILIGFIVLFLIILIKHLFFPDGIYSFIISIVSALVIGWWIIS